MESYCSGPVLFLTETCQVSACFCVHMLSMCKITVMLQIYKKPHKLGLQYTQPVPVQCKSWYFHTWTHGVSHAALWLQLSCHRHKKHRTKTTLSPLLFCLFKASYSNQERKGEKKNSRSTLGLYKEDIKQATPAAPLWRSGSQQNQDQDKDHDHPWTSPDYSITKKTSFASCFPSLSFQNFCCHMFICHILGLGGH